MLVGILHRQLHICVAAASALGGCICVRAAAHAGRSTCDWLLVCKKHVVHHSHGPGMLAGDWGSRACMCVPHFRWGVPFQCWPRLHPAKAHPAKLTEGKAYLAVIAVACLVQCCPANTWQPSMQQCNHPCTVQTSMSFARTVLIVNLCNTKALLASSAVLVHIGKCPRELVLAHKTACEPVSTSIMPLFCSGTRSLCSC